MANNQEISAKESISKEVKSKKSINYQGWSDKVALDVLNNAKMERVKQSIKNNISLNIKYYTNNKDNAMKLSPTIRILKDMNNYTTVILRCGTFPIWKNTVKLNEFEPVEILNDLMDKVETDFFKKEILSYLDKKKTNTSSSYVTKNKGNKLANSNSNNKSFAPRKKADIIFE